jgi:hypothetical protein
MFQVFQTRAQDTRLTAPESGRPKQPTLCLAFTLATIKPILHTSPCGKILVYLQFTLPLAVRYVSNVTDDRTRSLRNRSTHRFVVSSVT